MDQTPLFGPKLGQSCNHLLKVNHGTASIGKAAKMGNHKKTNEHKTHLSEELQKKLLPSMEPIDIVPLSVILPVYNCSEAIGQTLKSIQQQEYPSLEVIVVDADSTDRTLEIVNSYGSLISRTYTVADYNLPDMINRGISLVSGRYLTVLFPGTFYLSCWAYATFAKRIVEFQFPDLIYCGSIQREIRRDPRLVLLPFDTRLLEKGRHPATVAACWFRSDLFEKIGKLNTHYTGRAEYEFFCRIAKKEEVRSVMIDRVFVDFDYGRFSYGKVLRFAVDTWLIICEHFGIHKAIIWFFTLNHLTIIRGIWRRRNSNY